MEIKSDCLLLKLFHFMKREMKNLVYIKVNLKKILVYIKNGFTKKLFTLEKSVW